MSYSTERTLTCGSWCILGVVFNSSYACLSLHVLLPFVVEFHAFAGYWRGALLEGGCNINVFGHEPFAQKWKHTFVDCVLRNGRWIVQIGHVILQHRIAVGGKRPLLLSSSFRGIAFCCQWKRFLKNVSSIWDHQLCLADSRPIELVHSENICLHTHKA